MRIEDPRAGVGGEDAPGGLEAVELGHPDVHQDDGRLEARGLVHRLEPVARLGHDLDVRPRRTSSMRKPARTIDWSSATSTRMLIARRPASGRRVLRTKPPPLAEPARHLAAVDLDPLADADEPVAEPVAGIRAAAVVAYLDLQLVARVADDRRPRGWRRACLSALVRPSWTMR